MNAFQTKSRAIELLGRKQIRDGITALVELIKNSYDADAEWCRVIFNTKYTVPYLMIVDSGCGMSKSDILNKWLVIGTDSKKIQNRVTKKKRRYLMGQKGIGRLAASSLGRQLLMLSKSEEDGLWNILFIDWNTFENQYSLLSDVNVGLNLEISSNAIKAGLEEMGADLVKEVRSNIDKDHWFDFSKNSKNKTVKSDLLTIWNEINTQLSRYTADYKRLANQVVDIEKKGSGTILYVTNLYDDWEKILDSKEGSKDKRSDSYSQSNYTRLNTFIYPINQANKGFETVVFLNDQKLTFDYGFSDEDYKIYDIKISGKVENGKFIGEIDVVNGDKELLKKCNEELKRGISLAEGMDGEVVRKSDCGSFTLELRHIEGRKYNSGIPEDLWEKQVAKLENYGGVAIFRDGVRVLPYGEPQNDFLELEKRRSLSAGKYMFSHRRFFGRIDITEKNNPHLEDKSSREGLLENRYFYYFTEILKNLLIKIAVEYLNGWGIRDSYTKYNEEIHKMREVQKVALEQQNKELKEEISRINKLLKIGPEQFKTCRENTDLYINHVELLKGKLSYADTYLEIKELYKELNSLFVNIDKSIENLKDIKIFAKDKYKPGISIDIMEEVFSFNNKVTLLENNFRETLLKKQNEAKRIYNEQLEKWNRSIVALTGKEIGEFKKSLHTDISDIRSLVTVLKDNCIDALNTKYGEYKIVLDIIRKETENLNITKQNLLSTIGKTVSNFSDILMNLEARINALEHTKTQDLNREVKGITEELQRCSSEIAIQQRSLIQNCEVEVGNAVPKIRDIQNFINNDYSTTELIDSLTQRNLILEKENEMFSELAGIGLAAEVVDHEFNQYFNNVRNAITDLKKISLTPKAQYYLSQVDKGFRGISNRHSQLSPMYRSYNLKRKDTNVLGMLREIIDFYDVKIQNTGVEVICEVDEKATVFVSTSKIYPVLSNLLDNAIYWTKSGETKKILWRFDNKNKILYIEDSGSGIPMRLKDRIFDTFFTLKPPGVGRGLGLTIVRKILEAEGHKIEIIYDQNEKILPGACFKITFKEEN